MIFFKTIQVVLKNCVVYIKSKEMDEQKIQFYIHFEYGGYSSPLNMSAHGTPGQIDRLKDDLAAYARFRSEPVPKIVVDRPPMICSMDEILNRVTKFPPTRSPLVVCWKSCQDAGEMLTVISREAQFLSGVPLIVCAITCGPKPPWRSLADSDSDHSASE